MDEVLDLGKLKERQPAQAMWWLAGRLRSLAEAIHVDLEEGTQGSRRLA